MNPRSKEFSARDCYVCGYPFSDELHITPRKHRHIVNKVMHLCPNHSRFALILGVMMESDVEDESIVRFCRERFDTAFNRIALPVIVGAHNDLQSKVNPVGWFMATLFDPIFGRRISKEMGRYGDLVRRTEA